MLWSKLAIEDGTPMGLAMTDPDCSLDIGLRQALARTSALSGFDPHAIGVPTGAEVGA